jgi:ABC-type Fe3+ transport system substrate-binding protein
LAKLGIADQVKPKIKLLNEAAPAAVAKGEVEIGLGPMSEVLLVPGVRLAGPFPAGLQSYLVFMASVLSASKNPDAARSLIKFLTAPAAAPVFKRQRHGAAMIKATILSSQKPRHRGSRRKACRSLRALPSEGLDVLERGAWRPRCARIFKQKLASGCGSG